MDEKKNHTPPFGGAWLYDDAVGTEEILDHLLQKRTTSSETNTLSCPPFLPR